MNNQELTMKEIKAYYNTVSTNSQEINDYIFQFEINDLYSKAIGEIGLQPSEFWEMTPDELELAYKGYLIKLETTLNGIRLALLSPGEVIKLFDDDVSIGSIERQQYTLHLFRETLE